MLIKKLEIKKTKPTFVISVLKDEYCVGLVFSKSDFLLTKFDQGRKSVRRKSTFLSTFAFSLYPVLDRKQKFGIYLEIPHIF